MIELAVLDLNGTTVRDAGVVERALVEALTAAGLDVHGPGMPARLAFLRETMGMPRIDVLRALFLDDEERAWDAARRFEDAFDTAVARGEVEALPGAETALTALGAAGMRVCLVTELSGRNRDHLLDVLGWRDLVDLAVGPDDGLRGAPAPDLVLSAVMRLDVGAVRAVAVAGDTVSDLEAGTRAGATIVAGVLTGAHGREKLAAAPHTHLLEGIHELPEVIASAQVTV
ncbi:MAG: HAD hydrolase-like protein [Acidimicrobiia bacterium]